MIHSCVYLNVCEIVDLPQLAEALFLYLYVLRLLKRNLRRSSVSRYLSLEFDLAAVHGDGASHVYRLPVRRPGRALLFVGGLNHVDGVRGLEPLLELLEVLAALESAAHVPLVGDGVAVRLSAQTAVPLNVDGLVHAKGTVGVVVEQAFVVLTQVVAVSRGHEPLLLLFHHAFVMVLIAKHVGPVVLRVTHDLALLFRLMVLQLRMGSLQSQCFQTSS